MTPTSLRLRILTAIGASGLAILSTEACGATPPQPAPGGDAGADIAVAADGPVEEPRPEAAAADTSSDVAPDRTSVRRPLLVGTSLRSASAVPREDWLSGDLGVENAPSDVDATTLAALARAYAIDGCEEHASIAAFARLTLHLLAVGAPPELVERAHLASLDEIRHARACFALARRYGGRALGPGPLAMGELLPVSGDFGRPPRLRQSLARDGPRRGAAVRGHGGRGSDARRARVARRRLVCRAGRRRRSRGGPRCHPEGHRRDARNRRSHLPRRRHQGLERARSADVCAGEGGRGAGHRGGDRAVHEGDAGARDPHARAAGRRSPRLTLPPAVASYVLARFCEIHRIFGSALAGRARPDETRMTSCWPPGCLHPRRCRGRSQKFERWQLERDGSNG
jgi:hypothetical protein